MVPVSIPLAPSNPNPISAHLPASINSFLTIEEGAPSFSSSPINTLVMEIKLLALG
jgi:hypothetical protein